MSKLTGRIYHFCEMLFATIVSILLLCLVFVALFGAPIDLAAETIDLICMDGQTAGTITGVERVEGRRTTGARITYNFTYNGMKYESQRVFPGFIGNHGTWSGGYSMVSEKFPLNKTVDVYFNTSSPSTCALEFGWFKWSVGFFLGVWGTIAKKYFGSRKQILVILSNSLIIYGAIIIFIGPVSVRVNEIHWHVLAFTGIFLAIFLSKKFKNRVDAPDH